MIHSDKKCTRPDNPTGHLWDVVQSWPRGGATVRCRRCETIDVRPTHRQPHKGKINFRRSERP